MKSSDIIFKYTRADAIAAGTLIDLSNFKGMPRKTGFKFHIAITRLAFAQVIEGLERQPLSAKVVLKRVQTLLDFLHAAIRMAYSGNLVMFDALNPDDNDQFVKLKCVCGPDDEGSPALTIMLPDED